MLSKNEKMSGRNCRYLAGILNIFGLESRHKNKVAKLLTMTAAKPSTYYLLYG
jgi:hypothetical protein